MKANMARVSSLLLVLSGIIFLTGLLQVVSHRFSRADNSTDQPYKTSLTERDLAIGFVTNNATEEHSHATNQQRAKASADKLGAYLADLIATFPK
jgi:hypothetical protein